MSCDVGDEIPDFALDSTVGMIRFHDLIDGKPTLLLTVRSAFDPVTTTDIGALHKLTEEFEARNISVVILGDDNNINNRKWAKDIEELQLVTMKYPIVSDTMCAVLEKLGCARPMPPSGVIKPNMLGCFLIDIDKRVRTTMKYSPSIGRNIYEIIRIFDALNLVTFHKVVCPSNWANGQDVFVSNEITDDEASKLLPKGNIRIKPWFRLTSSNI